MKNLIGIILIILILGMIAYAIFFKQNGSDYSFDLNLGGNSDPFQEAEEKGVDIHTPPEGFRKEIQPISAE